MDPTPPTAPSKNGPFTKFMIGFVVVTIIAMAIALIMQPSLKTSQTPAPTAKVGDIVPVSSLHILTFGGPDPMKNAQDEAYMLGDMCEVAPDGSLEVIAVDGTCLLLLYREPRERGSDTRAGVDLNAERERLECPDRSPIISDQMQWDLLMREYRTHGGDQESLRQWIRGSLERNTQH